ACPNSCSTTRWTSSSSEPGVSQPKFMVGCVRSVMDWHVVPMTDHDSAYWNEIRMSVSLSLRKSRVRFARPGAVHWRATLRTRSCTPGSPSRKETVMVSPDAHLVFLTSAARSAPLALGFCANQVKHHL